MCYLDAANVQDNATSFSAHLMAITSFAHVFECQFAASYHTLPSEKRPESSLWHQLVVIAFLQEN